MSSARDFRGRPVRGVAAADTVCYTLRGYPGVAFRFVGEETLPWWQGTEVQTGRVLVRMVGDDRDLPVDPDDLTPIPARSYCRDCGQIGCTSNVYE